MKIDPVRQLQSYTFFKTKNHQKSQVPIYILLWQADGAIGEPSDKSDFSLHVWDSFSQEISHLLFIFYGQKSLIYLKCSDFLPK